MASTMHGHTQPYACHHRKSSCRRSMSAHLQLQQTLHSLQSMLQSLVDKGQDQKEANETQSLAAFFSIHSLPSVNATPCRYGEQCYCTDADHFIRFRHDCKYGAKCYRKNPYHFAKWYHPDECVSYQQMLAACNAAKARAKQDEKELEEDNSVVPEGTETLDKPGFTRTLYHITSPDSAKSILKEGFRPGSQGLFGGGIYFAESEELCRSKAQRSGVTLKCKVRTGRAAVFRKPDYGMTHDRLKALGCHSIFAPGRRDTTDACVNNPEWCIYDKAQVLSVEVASGNVDS